MNVHSAILEKSSLMASLLRRALSSSPALMHAASSSSLSPTYPRGMLEIREYTLKPEGAGAYSKLANDYGDVRKQLLPLLGSVMHDAPQWPMHYLRNSREKTLHGAWGTILFQ